MAIIWPAIWSWLLDVTMRYHHGCLPAERPKLRVSTLALLMTHGRRRVLFDCLSGGRARDAAAGNTAGAPDFPPAEPLRRHRRTLTRAGAGHFFTGMPWTTTSGRRVGAHRGAEQKLAPALSGRLGARRPPLGPSIRLRQARTSVI